MLSSNDASKNWSGGLYTMGQENYAAQSQDLKNSGLLERLTPRA